MPGPVLFAMQPGEKWESNCQECECPMDSTTPLCKPVECSIKSNKTCEKAGQVPMVEIVDCCEKFTCECDVDTCPQTSHTCSEGFQPIVTTPKGSCCPEYDCQPKPVCVYNKTEYQPGQIWTPPNDKCSKYKCEKIEDQLVPVEVKMVCPEFNPENCIPGTEKTDEDGCCETCTPHQDCKVMKNSTHLEKNGCKTTEPVEVNSCEGNCATSSMYSVEANSMVHACSCCQEMSTSSKEVEMACPDGTKISYTYTYVETCGCKPLECPEEKSSQKVSRRRRR
ncbi:hypothetical protein ANANG_G00210800 [Anguilla anguilla]|uniref:CTCK domain-containing protein n=1 Tax=Anguilla anguilla TaxID=7936 RepID=A0A9D3LZQ0_ANGAN|nr:hypothetical protein ANANG_G00210800 [Anguilla anguilla]